MKLADTRRALKEMLANKVFGLGLGLGLVADGGGDGGGGGNPYHDEKGRFTGPGDHDLGSASDAKLQQEKEAIQGFLNGKTLAHSSVDKKTAAQRLSKISAEQRSRASGSSSNNAGSKSATDKGSSSKSVPAVKSPAPAPAPTLSGTQREKSAAARGYKVITSGPELKAYGERPRNIDGKPQWTPTLNQAQLNTINQRLDKNVIYDTQTKTFLVPPAFNGGAHDNFESTTNHNTYRAFQFGLGDILFDHNGGGPLAHILGTVKPLFIEKPVNESRIGNPRHPDGALNPVYHYSLPGSNKVVLGVSLDPKSNRVTSLWATYPDKPYTARDKPELRDLVSEMREKSGLGGGRYQVISVDDYRNHRFAVGGIVFAGKAMGVKMNDVDVWLEEHEGGWTVQDENGPVGFFDTKGEAQDFIDQVRGTGAGK